MTREFVALLQRSLLILTYAQDARGGGRWHTHQDKAKTSKNMHLNIWHFEKLEHNPSETSNCRTKKMEFHVPETWQIARGREWPGDVTLGVCDVTRHYLTRSFTGPPVLGTEAALWDIRPNVTLFLCDTHCHGPISWKSTGYSRSSSLMPPRTPKIRNKHDSQAGGYGILNMNKLSSQYEKTWSAISARFLTRVQNDCAWCSYENSGAFQARAMHGVDRPAYHSVSHSSQCALFESRVFIENW